MEVLLTSAQLLTLGVTIDVLLGEYQCPTSDRHLLYSQYQTPDWVISGGTPNLM